MKDMQAHLTKIRSDAAECVLLGNLAIGERRILFSRMAEHLTGLALEIEKTTAGGPSIAPVAPYLEAAVADLATDHRSKAVPLTDVGGAQKLAKPSRRLLSSLLIVVVGLSAGTLIWANKPVGEHSARFIAKYPEALGTNHDRSNPTIPTRLTGELEKWRAELEQLATLGTRVEDLERSLINIKIKRAAAGNEARLIGAAEKPVNAANGISVQENVLPVKDKYIASMDGLNIAKPSDTSQQANGSLPVTPTTAAAVNATKGAKVDRTTANIGPAGCTHFRSFDIVSGTYITFDGRRRRCR